MNKLSICAIILILCGITFGQDGCKCVNEDCGCCLAMVITDIGLNATACLNLTYISKDIGISLTFSIDGTVYYNDTISLEDPDVCFSVPVVKVISICLDFYDMTYSDTQVDGCVNGTGSILGIEVINLPFGCFHLSIPADHTLPQVPFARIIHKLNGLHKKKLLK